MLSTIFYLIKNYEYKHLIYKLYINKLPFFNNDERTKKFRVLFVEI